VLSDDNLRLVIAGNDKVLMHLVVLGAF